MVGECVGSVNASCVYDNAWRDEPARGPSLRGAKNEDRDWKNEAMPVVAVYTDHWR